MSLSDVLRDLYNLADCSAEQRWNTMRNDYNCIYSSRCVYNFEGLCKIDVQLSELYKSGLSDV